MEITTINQCKDDTEIKLQDILDAIPFYVLLVDSDHYIIEANKAVKTHLGIEREEIIGKYCPLVIHGIQEPYAGCPLEEAVERNSAVEKELYDKKTGRWVISAIYPTRAVSSGGKRIYLHMVTDITERKVAQEQLKNSREQLRGLSAYLETVREEEKRTIARDLHDETSQVLASLHAYLEAAIGNLPSNATRSKELLEKARNLSTTILDGVHELIYQLRPVMLDELGLVDAIKALMESSLEVSGVNVSLKVIGEVRRMPAPVEIAIYRIIQEAFNNILKHARAKNVSVRVSFSKNHVRVKIKDDGTGFDVQEVFESRDKTRGMGLIGIRERVELMKGTLNIKSSPGKGTEIILKIPDKDYNDGKDQSTGG